MIARMDDFRSSYLAPSERRELKRRARSRSLAVESVRRANVILMLAAGGAYSEICERLGCSDRYISLWKERFQQERLSGLDSRYRGAKHRLGACQRMDQPTGAAIGLPRRWVSASRRSVE
jgi:DNA-binding CsgD family transcriptional regulator